MFIAKEITVNWDAVSAIATAIEVLLLFLPAIIMFVYYKCSFVKFWTYTNEQNGIKLMLYNKTKFCLFIVSQKIIIKNKRNIRSVEIFNYIENKNGYIVLKPDSVCHIEIDYLKHKITDLDKIYIEIKFANKKNRKYKIR